MRQVPLALRAVGCAASKGRRPYAVARALDLDPDPEPDLARQIRIQIRQVSADLPDHSHRRALRQPNGPEDVSALADSGFDTARRLAGGAYW